MQIQYLQDDGQDQRLDSDAYTQDDTSQDVDRTGHKVALEQAVSKQLQELNLPAGWKVGTSKTTGRTYYYNKGTGEKGSYYYLPLRVEVVE